MLQILKNPYTVVVKRNICCSVEIENSGPNEVWGKMNISEI